ncbi:Reticulon-like protein B4 [Zea mays]|uniref:Reticulon-like protein B4 n=1 Tax=Zea mays TaxID=4577 RepID=A0A1D6H564_MAIZE|nr:Reticulon-like protein B4 [Zea mays]AQK69964.1 Reticulon-like protein B4 [Zea mays]
MLFIWSCLGWGDVYSNNFKLNSISILHDHYLPLNPLRGCDGNRFPCWHRLPAAPVADSNMLGMNTCFGPAAAKVMHLHVSSRPEPWNCYL